MTTKNPEPNRTKELSCLDRQEKERIAGKVTLLMISYYSQLLGLSNSEFLSRLFGVRVMRYGALTKNDRDAVKKKTGDMVALSRHLLQEAECTRNATDLDDAGRLRQNLQLADKFANFLELPAGQDSTDRMMKAWDETGTYLIELESSYYGYFSSTKFREYCCAIQTIVGTVYEVTMHDPRELDEFLREAFASEDMRILLSSAIHAQDHYGYLDKSMSRMTKSRLQKLVYIYSFLSGVFEKQIRILLGLLVLMKGEYSSYSRIRNAMLAENVKILLSASPPFIMLVNPFKVNIRNAIAHSQYKPHYVKQEIKFVDRKLEVTLSFDQFLTEVRNFSMVVDALWFLYFSIFSLYFRRIRDSVYHLRHVKRG